MNVENTFLTVQNTLHGYPNSLGYRFVLDEGSSMYRSSAIGV